jgi:hypothetical protein
MTTHRPDSPSRMCDGSLDEAAHGCWIIQCRSFGEFVFYAHEYVYPCLSSSHTHMCTRIDSPSGLVWRTVLRPHTSASSVLPPPLPPHPHVPAPPPTLTCLTPHLSLA